MSHALKLDDHAHEVWLAREPGRAGHYTVHDSGDMLARDASLRAFGGSVHELLMDGQAQRLHLVVHGDDIHIHLDGQTFSLRYLHSLTRYATTASGSADSLARAPMPGSVIAVHVAPGDTVERGQTLLVIESMKMETAIAAPRAGRVQAVHVSQGQTFERDATLITLDPAQATA